MDIYRPQSIITEVLDDLQPDTESPLEFPFQDEELLLRDERELDRMLEYWREHPDSFIRDCVRYPFANGGVQPLKLEDYHREALELVADADTQMLIICWPKRHGKTMLNAALGCWRACTQRHQGIAVLATSREHAETTLYGYEYQMFRHSPFLRWLCGGETNVHERAGIYVPYTDSAIRPLPCRIGAVSGRPFSMLQCTELREVADEDVFHMAASQTEQAGAITIVDSSAAEPDNLLTELHETAAEGDVSIREHYFEGTRAPWITEKWLKSRREVLPAPLFSLWHENKFGAGAGRYFSDRQIARMKTDWPESLSEIALLRRLHEMGASGYVACGGLDRSAPWTDPGSSDRTVWTVIARFDLPERKGDADAWRPGDHYVVVRQIVFKLRDMESIKRQIERDCREFNLAQAVFEQYQCGDLYLWALGKGIPSRLSHARGQEQMTMFSVFHELAEQGRIHAPASCQTLWTDMRDFDVIVDGERVTFGASKKRKRKKRGRVARDDTVYSVGLALLGFQNIDPGMYATPGAEVLDLDEFEKVGVGDLGY